MELRRDRTSRFDEVQNNLKPFIDPMVASQMKKQHGPISNKHFSPDTNKDFHIQPIRRPHFRTTGSTAAPYVPSEPPKIGTAVVPMPEPELLPSQALPEVQQMSELPPQEEAVMIEEFTEPGPVSAYTEELEQSTPRRGIRLHVEFKPLALPSLPSRGFIPSLLKRPSFVYGTAGVIFFAGLLMGLSGLRTSHQVDAEVRQSRQELMSVTSTPDNRTPAVVKDTTTSGETPAYVSIPKLGIYASVDSEKLAAKGQIQVPTVMADAGWYNVSAPPGQMVGMLLNGHAGVNGSQGVFDRLGSLAMGDQITVTSTNKQSFVYTVVSSQIVDSSNVSMLSMLTSADRSKPGLNVITATGDQLPGISQSDQVVLVRAVIE